jgi:hypothetical protein
MTVHFDTLSRAKQWSSGEIAALVRDLLPKYIGCSQNLRSAFDSGRLFRVAPGEHYDTIAVETALVSLILANVSVHDPFARSRQIHSIAEACADLGVSYEDALDMTLREQMIREVLATAH